ncbi:helix-turn-helix domain-containing protein [Nocardia sp. NPDC004068]|uniref:helix-turn-helix domain-containing protein n=1 Tax=Nocardia sp. NPDC004068 TaxID=3364303 RepID=UPI00369D83A6
MSVPATGNLCASCLRAAGLSQPIPPNLYNDPTIRNALARYDFGTVFVAVRKKAGLSQMQLGALLDLSQSRISAVERGERNIGHIKLVARIAARLSIPAHLLGFTPELDGTLAREEVSWMDRRDFLILATAATLGSSLHPELARLGNALPGEAAPVTRTSLGAADIDAIEAISAAFRRWDMAHGGGLCRMAALAQVQQVRALETASCSEEIRIRYWIAAAELAAITGWLCCDAEDHDTARRLWTYALDLTHRGQADPRSTDLAVSILLDMIHQSRHLWHPLNVRHGDDQRRKEALSLANLAATTASTRKHPVGAITAGFLSDETASCWALLGETEQMRRALGTAQEQYTASNADNTHSWTSYITPAEISAGVGTAYFLLSLTDPAAASAAIDPLTTAVNSHTPEHAHSRASQLPTLTAACLRAGDYEAAAAYGREAAVAVNSVSSQRCRTRLRDLDALAAHYDRNPQIADMREAIRPALVGAG